MPTRRQPQHDAAPVPTGSTASSASTGDPMGGRVLDGRYRIGARIARGGMASVYEALDLRLDRTVAIKIMHAGLGDDEEFAARFVREARAAARLSHPHVVAVHDQGDDDGVVFLAMELVAGHTLRDTVAKESPMPPGRALALLEPVVSALAAAHRAGIIHRDVKPENVLIAEDPHTGAEVVKVADFGLARAVSADTQHTATGGVLIGTVSYLAPELVVDGRSDTRADVYAVGVVLHELLTGRKPHEGETPIQVAYKHVHADVPAPSRQVPGIPPYVDALVARATARDRSQRPADAGVLLHQLHRVQHALAAGVADDADLTEDLSPVRPAPGVASAAVAAPGDTAPEVWDPEEIEALLGPDRSRPVPEPTSWLPRQGESDDAEAPRPAGPVRLTGPTALALAAHDAGAAPTTSPDTVAVPVLDRDAPAGSTGGSGAAPAHPGGRSAPPGARPRRSRRGLLLLVVALVLAVGVGGGAYWFGWARYSTVPAVLDQTGASAVTELEAAGFEVVVGDPVYSDDVAEGRVVSTDPDPGSRLVTGREVTLVTSLGVEEYEVPRLAGRTRAEAEDALRDLTLVPGRVRERFSERVPEGVVIRSTPGTGAVRRPGATVDLVVSKGRRPLQVGDWVGRSADQAEQTLTERGLVVVRDQEVFDDEIAAGDVVSQSPDGGTLFAGETVTFVVSKGPELVEMPRLTASGVDAARERLEDLGFEVRVENSSTYIGLGYVLSTDPDPGDMVPKGSTVTLFLV